MPELHVPYYKQIHKKLKFHNTLCPLYFFSVSYYNELKHKIDRRLL